MPMVASGYLDHLVGLLAARGQELLKADDGRQDEGQLAHDEGLTGEHGEGSELDGDHETGHHEPQEEEGGQSTPLPSPACNSKSRVKQGIACIDELERERKIMSLWTTGFTSLGF